jgi:hypothetical protein
MGREAVGSGATLHLTSNPRASGEWVTTGDHSPTWTRGQGGNKGERFACGRDLRPFNQNMQGGLKVGRYNMFVCRSFEALFLLWVCITVHNLVDNSVIGGSHIQPGCHVHLHVTDCCLFLLLVVLASRMFLSLYSL